jgi:hypothetical protein
MPNLRIVSGLDGSPNLKTLDFRDCPNLVEAYHSVQQETIYISAGMTKYVGCIYDNTHTGNLVVDLNGFYTLGTDGSKTADMTKVLSSTLLWVLALDENQAYNPETKTLTIPAGQEQVVVKAGEGTHWTFYTDLGEIPDDPIDPPDDPVDPPVDPIDPDSDPVDPVNPMKPDPDPIKSEGPVAEAAPLDLPEDDELELPEAGDSTKAFVPLVTAGFALAAAGSALTLRRKKLN